MTASLTSSRPSTSCDNCSLKNKIYPSLKLTKKIYERSEVILAPKFKLIFSVFLTEIPEFGKPERKSSNKRLLILDLQLATCENFSQLFRTQGLTVAFTLGFEHIAGSRRAKCLAKWTGSHAFFPSEKVDITKGTLWLKTQKNKSHFLNFLFSPKILLIRKFPQKSHFQNLKNNIL